MQSHELYQQMPAELSHGIIKYLREEERDVYKSIIASLTVQKKLRPVFIQKRPLEKQFEWILSTLSTRMGNDVGEQVLQVYLMKAQNGMLVDFLEALKIEHQEGAVDDLPEEMDAAEVKAAVDTLLEKYDPATTSLYLRVFQSQRPDGWPAITEVLENDARLKW
jgi:hypothetical protein